MRPPHINYGWNPIETAPLDEDIALRVQTVVASPIHCNGRSAHSVTAHCRSFAAPNRACGQLLVWSTGLRRLGACQIRREREPRLCRARLPELLGKGERD
jgi:hypothetical protein